MNRFSLRSGTSRTVNKMTCQNAFGHDFCRLCEGLHLLRYHRHIVLRVCSPVPFWSRCGCSRSYFVVLGRARPGDSSWWIGCRAPIRSVGEEISLKVVCIRNFDADWTGQDLTGSSNFGYGLAIWVLVWPSLLSGAFRRVPRVNLT